MADLIKLTKILTVKKVEYYDQPNVIEKQEHEIILNLDEVLIISKSHNKGETIFQLKNKECLIIKGNLEDFEYLCLTKTTQ